MRLLLDTHSFLWFIEGDRRLSADARRLIENLSNDRFLSIASIWEIAIKVSGGKLSLLQPIEQLVPRQLVLNRISLLGVTIHHAAVVAVLPFHHRDPFDRMLIVQAQTEQMAIVSADSLFDAYGVIRLW